MNHWHRFAFLSLLFYIKVYHQYQTGLFVSCRAVALLSMQVLASFREWNSALFHETVETGVAEGKIEDAAEVLSCYTEDAIAEVR
jgi:hypothetical protein